MAVAAREGERGARRSRSLSLTVVVPLTIVAAAVAIAFAAPYVYAERALPGVSVELRGANGALAATVAGHLRGDDLLAPIMRVGAEPVPIPSGPLRARALPTTARLNGRFPLRRCPIWKP